VVIRFKNQLSQKSEVYVFGVDQHEKVRMANMLNCALGSLPLKYLAIPISDGHLQSSVLPILEKMKKRLDQWKGKHLSSGGRLVLTNSCLRSLPLYTMGFYIFPKNMHPKMDVGRANFFWQSAEGNNKYHMAKWGILIRPKDQ
jgi:hypothetical protein